MVLSEAALQEGFSDMAAYFGEADFLAAALLDERDSVRAMAHEFIAEWDRQSADDVARDAAHSVVRPAAPLATFLVGYAAGQRGAAGDDIGPECDVASTLAQAWVAQ